MRMGKLILNLSASLLSGSDEGLAFEMSTSQSPLGGGVLNMSLGGEVQSCPSYPDPV